MRHMFPSSIAALLITGPFALGCTDTDGFGPSDDGDVLLAPPPEGEGIQLSMDTLIPAASEVEHCMFVKSPPEDIWVNHDEVRYTVGSHHALVYQTQYEEIPTTNNFGDVIDTSGVFDCSAGPTFGWDAVSVIAGSQNYNGDSTLDLPEGVALPIPANTVLMINAHYINAASEPIEPEVRVNFYTVPEETVEHEAGVLFWYNIFIHLDPKSDGYTRMSCPVDSDITLATAQSHMHARGVNYWADLITEEGDRQTLYENTAWEGVPVKRWEDGRKISAGSRIEYQCEYQNTENREIWQGARSTDEMCMFLGAYWPANTATSLCSADPERAEDTFFLGADWVGQGEGTCADALQCVQGIDADEFAPFLEDLTLCFEETSPDISGVTSDAIRCFLTSDDPIAGCTAEIGACLAE